jgi:rhamnulokinase
LSERARAFHLAVDLGAGSGRAIVGAMSSSRLRLDEVHRFHYPPREHAGHLRWNFGLIVDGIQKGLRAAEAFAASRGGRLESLGVDSWGVDYGLIDAEGQLLEDPVCYRDRRTSGLMDEVAARIPREDLFARTGIQFLPINTVYQLAAHAREGFPEGVSRLLMIPDLCHHALCGSQVGERTNASTTQLLCACSGQWDAEIFNRVGLPESIMPALVGPGTEIGSVGRVLVVAPATHDTASAVAGTPLRRDWAYISSGTWSLVGCELDAPLLTDAAREQNFTNEAGVGGTVRFLKNVTGLWILEGCLREWEAAGLRVDRGRLLEHVAAVDGRRGLLLPDDAAFFNPPSMVGAVREHLLGTGQSAPDDPVLITKIILDSLAARYASVIRTIESLTARRIRGIHVVGGGSLNGYLNQATADAAGVPVMAGPAEATAAGNVIVQAIACGELSSIAEARELLARSVELRTYEPQAVST